MKLEEALYYLNEAEKFEEQEEIELEGSYLLKDLEDLTKLVNEVVDVLTSRDTILCETATIIDVAQMEAMKQLGNILDAISNI